MTNIFKFPEKKSMKQFLLETAIQALEEKGWKVEKERGIGKSSVRRITKGAISKLASIRTSQDTWIAFPRTDDDKSWETLDQVEAVVAASVDDKDDPRFAKIHLFDAKEIRSRFDRLYAARMKANHSIPLGRGIWLSLYHQEGNDPISHVGAGAGLENHPIAVVPLAPTTSKADRPIPKPAADKPIEQPHDAPLTIAEAKRRLAATHGVDETKIKIIIEG